MTTGTYTADYAQSLLYGIVLIVVGLLVGPGGVSVFTWPARVTPCGRHRDASASPAVPEPFNPASTTAHERPGRSVVGAEHRFLYIRATRRYETHSTLSATRPEQDHPLRRRRQARSSGSPPTVVVDEDERGVVGQLTVTGVEH